MKVIRDKTELIKNNKIYQDFINDPQKVHNFFPLYYKDDIAWQTIIDSAKSKNADHNELCKILEKQNIEFGITQNTIENINRLGVGLSFAVVTGQQ
ncbi:MAG: bacillithiol biosynthesis protein BshC, partial [Candidatus Poribacteria bacterium]